MNYGESEGRSRNSAAESGTEGPPEMDGDREVPCSRCPYLLIATTCAAAL